MKNCLIIPLILYVNQVLSYYPPYRRYYDHFDEGDDYEVPMWKKERASYSYKDFRKAFSKARNLLVFTGAGLSADAHVPVDMTRINYWPHYEAILISEQKVFSKFPAVIWEFYHYLREIALNANVSKAHSILANLEQRMVYAGRKMTIMTTNVDGLHQKAGNKRVIELHGSAIRTRCTICDNVKLNKDIPICPALKGERNYSYHENNNYVKTEDLPHCTKRSCGGLLKPDVLLYGEQLRREVNVLAEKAMSECDFVIAIGCSFRKLPSGIWPFRMRRKGITVAEFNTDETKYSQEFKTIRYNNSKGNTVEDRQVVLVQMNLRKYLEIWYDLQTNSHEWINLTVSHDETALKKDKV